MMSCQGDRPPLLALAARPALAQLTAYKQTNLVSDVPVSVFLSGGNLYVSDQGTNTVGLYGATTGEVARLPFVRDFLETARRECFAKLDGVVPVQ